ncbi:unnamed protein product [Victoria cruziana]
MCSWTIPEETEVLSSIHTSGETFESSSSEKPLHRLLGAVTGEEKRLLVVNNDIRFCKFLKDFRLEPR